VKSAAAAEEWGDATMRDRSTSVMTKKNDSTGRSGDMRNHHAQTIIENQEREVETTAGDDEVILLTNHLRHLIEIKSVKKREKGTTRDQNEKKTRNVARKSGKSRM
jgi:hypothetical protein